MPLFRKKPIVSLEAAMSAKPIRLVDATMRDGRLAVELRPPKWAAWFAKYPKNATKSFEFDAIGIFVWEQIDGRTTVEQIVRRLAEKYKLNLREAQVPTVTFLKTLITKGLIGVPVDAKETP